MANPFGSEYFTPFSTTPATPGGSPEAGGGPVDSGPPGSPYVNYPYPIPPVTVTGTPDATTDMGPPGIETGGAPAPGGGATNPATDWGSILAKIIPGLYSGASSYGSYKQELQNANQYMDLAGKYADQMNPFGSQRPYYQDKLRQLETDPNAYLASSPDYQAALKQGLATIDRSMSAGGFAGSGHATGSAQEFGSTLAAQFLDRDRQSLMQMAGAQIGPGAAANLISHGIDASVQARNNALANLARAFNPNAKGGSLTSGLGDIISAISRAFGSGGGGSSLTGVAASLLKSGMSKDDIKKLLGIDDYSLNAAGDVQAGDESALTSDFWNKLNSGGFDGSNITDLNSGTSDL